MKRYKGIILILVMTLITGSQSLQSMKPDEQRNDRLVQDKTLLVRLAYSDIKLLCNMVKNFEYNALALLFRFGLDPNLKDPQGFPLFHHTFTTDREQANRAICTIKTFLLWGADVRLKDSFDMDALQHIRSSREDRFSEPAIIGAHLIEQFYNGISHNDGRPQVDQRTYLFWDDYTMYRRNLGPREIMGSTTDSRAALTKRYEDIQVELTLDDDMAHVRRDALRLVQWAYEKRMQEVTQ